MISEVGGHNRVGHPGSQPGIGGCLHLVLEYCHLDDLANGQDAAADFLAEVNSGIIGSGHHTGVRIDRP